MNIHESITNTIASTIAMTICLIVITIVILGFSGDTTPVSKGISMVGNYVGSITTLAAAYIAYLIYSGWKTVEEFKAIQALHYESVNALQLSTKALGRIAGQFTIIEIEKNKGPLTEEIKKKLTANLTQTVKEVIIEVQNLTFSMCVKIAMAYTKPLENDPDLKFIFNTLNEMKIFVQKIVNDKGINDNNYKEIAEFIKALNTKLDKKIRDQNTK